MAQYTCIYCWQAQIVFHNRLKRIIAALLLTTVAHNTAQSNSQLHKNYFRRSSNSCQFIWTWYANGLHVSYFYQKANHRFVSFGNITICINYTIIALNINQIQKNCSKGNFFGARKTNLSVFLLNPGVSFGNRDRNGRKESNFSGKSHFCPLGLLRSKHQLNNQHKDEILIFFGLLECFLQGKKTWVWL